MILTMGAFLAKTEAAGNEDLHLVGDGVFPEGLPEILHDLLAFGGLAARATAAQDLQMRGSFVKAASLRGHGPVPFLPHGQGFCGRPSDAFEGIGRGNLHLVTCN